MNKKVLLIGYNYYPEPTGVGKYSGEQVYWLAKQGYDCTVVTTYPYYPYWKVQSPYCRNRFSYTSEVKEFESGGKIRVYRCPIYVPGSPSGIKRIILDISFMVSGSIKLLDLVFRNRFDVVIAVAPSFMVGLLGVLYKSIKNTTLVYHIQDMQIEAAKNLKMIKSDKVINMLFKLEKFIFDQSDVVTSISDGMVEKIKNKAGKDVYLLPNWADTTRFFPIHSVSDLKQTFGFENTDRIIMYSGALGEKQGLESIIHAADYFRDIKGWKFIICGSGPYKLQLKRLAEALDLDNVVFFPLQPLDSFNKFLNIADVHLVIQKNNASDLVMPSKLTTILAVGGLAVVTANRGTSLYSMVNKYGVGMLVEAENQQALNCGIQEALLGSNKEVIASNARLYAEKYLSINNIMRSFEDLVLNDRNEMINVNNDVYHDKQIELPVTT